MTVARVVVLVMSTAACNALFGLDEVEPRGLNPRFIRFDNTERVDLVDFPVLIALDSTRIEYSRVTDPTVDLRFEDPATGADLPFEVESWNPDGESDVWVHVPLIHARSTADQMLMYYGSDAHGHADPAATWAGYDVVLHGKPNDYSNAAGSLFQGTATGIMAATGVIGSAYQFPGAGRHTIKLANGDMLLGGLSAFTIELWLYADYPTQALGGEPSVFQKQGVFDNGRLIGVGVDGLARIQIDVHFANTTSYDTNGYIQTQTWVHLVWAYDGNTLWLYSNAGPHGIETPLTPPIPSSNFGVVLGSDTNPFQGALDEIRIAHVFHDFSWVDAQYKSMTGRFVVFDQP